MNKKISVEVKYLLCYIEGEAVAKYCGENLHKTVVHTEAYKKANYVDALKHGFLKCDDDMLHTDGLKDEMAGAAAVAVLLKDNHIYCSNCGDSRSVASVNGVAQELSHDHKPTNEGELKRIVAAGGWVEVNRVNGNLALSRAMGDFSFKRNANRPPEEQIVTAYPEVIVEELTPEHEFIILACDGIWDVLSSQEAVDFVRSRIGNCINPDQICEELMEHCLAPDCQMGGLGCDNMTVVLVCILNEKSYVELASRCSKPSQINGASRDDGAFVDIITTQKMQNGENEREMSKEIASDDQKMDIT